jgi:hypothetical protein
MKYNIKMCFKELGCEGVAEYCEHGNEPSGPITSGKFPDQLDDDQLLWKVCVQLS